VKTTGSRVVIAAFVLFVAFASTAAAHGGLQQSDPEDGARLGEAPRRVTMTFSEVPAGESVLKVVDGCKRDVVASTSVAGNDLVGAIGDAQPGRWKATYRVISAEDGHLTKGALRFTVDGAKDCNPDDDGDARSTEEPEDPGGDTGSPPGGEDGDSFPVVPVAVGAAGLLIVGLVVRRVSAG
jgi:methionine-rich copper-binding protein CopC